MNWLRYFEHNRDHRLPIPWECGVHPEPTLRAPLIRSLLRFQVGESGEGRHLRRQAAATGDADYIAAINLFVKEEQEHARLMAEILGRLDVPLLKHHWSDVVFVLLRRLFKLRGELLVLLVPEIIAKRYFRAVHDGTADPVIRAVCAQIGHDEEGHIAFHQDTLRRAFASGGLAERALIRLVWRTVFRAACLVVMWDHRGVLKAARVTPAQFWWDCGLIFDEVAAAILSHASSTRFTQPTALPA
jgi:hypothetical protein